jgi:hypothetical protein
VMACRYQGLCNMSHVGVFLSAQYVGYSSTESHVQGQREQWTFTHEAAKAGRLLEFPPSTLVARSGKGAIERRSRAHCEMRI